MAVILALAAAAARAVGRPAAGSSVAEALRARVGSWVLRCPGSQTKSQAALLAAVSSAVDGLSHFVRSTHQIPAHDPPRASDQPSNVQGPTCSRRCTSDRHRPIAGGMHAHAAAGRRVSAGPAPRCPATTRALPCSSLRHLISCIPRGVADSPGELKLSHSHSATIALCNTANGIPPAQGTTFASKCGR
eukprot:1657178-Prymnesium_polylepis.1